MDYLKKINECSLFKGMSQESVDQFLAETKYAIKVKQAGESIIREGYQQKSLLILLEGTVYGKVTDEKGKVFHLTEQKAPIALATALLFGKNMGYPINVIAKTQCMLLQIERQEVLRLMQTNKLFLENYMQKVAERAHFLHNKITCFSLRTLKERIVLYLLSLSKNQNTDTVYINKSQNELANYFGVNRPSLTREIRNLHKMGLIEADGKEIILLKKRELQEMVDYGSNDCISKLCS